MPGPARLRFLRVLRTRWRDERSRRGVWPALRAVAADGLEFLRDSTPARRRQRYGDIEFDCDFRVDTTSANLGGGTRLQGAIAGGGYQPIQPLEFRQSMERLPIDFAQFTFVDLGSGKGRALLLASDYPFRRIVGVELLPELHAIAERNIARYRSDAQRCSAIETHLGDARDYQFPLEPLVLYLFNPFPDAVFETVLGRLEGSLRERPRPAYVVYHNPERRQLFGEKRFLQVIAATPQFIVYRAGTVD